MRTTLLPLRRSKSCRPLRGYGLRLRFEGNAVPIDRWEEKLDRLGRFFAKGMKAELTAVDPTCFDLKLLPDA